MFVITCSLLAILGAWLGTVLIGEIGFWLGLLGGIILGWYFLGNFIDDLNGK